MLRLRLIFGSSLGATAIAVYLVDAWLSTLTPPTAGPTLLGVPLTPWVYRGGLSTALTLLVTCLAASELCQIARAGDFRPFRWLAIIFAGGMSVGPYVSYHMRNVFQRNDEGWGMMWLATALALAYLVQALRRRTERALANTAITIFIIFYTGGLTGFLTKLRMDTYAEVQGAQAASGVLLVFFTILVTKFTDIGAFFVGMHLGRNKLIEWLSPKKTWEGFFGGLATAVVASLAAGSYLHFSGLARLPDGWMGYPVGLLVYGLVVGLLSVAGDLCASLLKRDASLKDSGRLIPGMGGVIDVLDSILLAAPAAWFFWARVIGVGAQS